MTIRESIRSHRDAVKNQSIKVKLAYFWEYYGIKTVFLLVIASILIYLFVHIIAQKEPGNVGVFFGASEKRSSEAFLDEFARFANLNLENYDVAIQLSPGIQLDGTITEEVYQTIEGFTTMVAANTVDQIAADADLFLYFSYLGFNADLRLFFNETQISILDESINYIDGDLLRQYQSKEKNIDYNHFPDPKRPEDMIDPIPVGIDLSAATDAFHNIYSFAGDDAVIGICATSERMLTAVAFIKFTLGLV